MKLDIFGCVSIGTSSAQSQAVLPNIAKPKHHIVHAVLRPVLGEIFHIAKPGRSRVMACLIRTSCQTIVIGS